MVADQGKNCRQSMVHRTYAWTKSYTLTLSVNFEHKPRTSNPKLQTLKLYVFLSILPAFLWSNRMKRRSVTTEFSFRKQFMALYCFCLQTIQLTTNTHTMENCKNAQNHTT
jgi:hypothetical protein